MPRTARQAFLESPHRAEFARVVNTRAFDAACEYALLTFLEELPGEADPNNAWGAHCRTMGARDALKILRGLCEPPPEPHRERLPTLKPPK